MVDKLWTRHGELPDAGAHRRYDESVAHEGRQDHEGVEGDEEGVVGLRSSVGGAFTSNVHIICSPFF